MIDTNSKWKPILESLGALWIHDGNKKRPYALLTSGKISSGFFNASLVIEDPDLLRKASTDLLMNLSASLTSTHGPSSSINRVVGSANGATSIAYELASQLQTKTGFTEKTSDGGMNMKRFNFEVGDLVLYAEDVLTTGGTTVKTIEACRSAGASDFGFVLTLVNRSGMKTLCDMPIISLVAEEMPIWERGENPFTDDGQEIIEPVRPKESWGLLTGEIS